MNNKDLTAQMPLDSKDSLPRMVPHTRHVADVVETVLACTAGMLNLQY